MRLYARTGTRHKCPGILYGGCLFEKDVTGIVAAVEAAGIHRIYLACQQTGLIDILAGFQAENWHIGGVHPLEWGEGQSINAIKLIMK